MVLTVKCVLNQTDYSNVISHFKHVFRLLMSVDDLPSPESAEGDGAPRPLGAPRPRPRPLPRTGTAAPRPRTGGAPWSRKNAVRKIMIYMIIEK